MDVTEVLEVDALITRLGCRHWLEGGWGVDALLGRQTREHRDVDIDIDADFESAVIDGLADRGYVIETDWRPNRVELVAPGGRRVDLHPIDIRSDGSARQAGLDGGWHEFPAAYFSQGSLAGTIVACVSLEAQVAFHTGYQLREVDKHDLAQLSSLGHGGD